MTVKTDWKTVKPDKVRTQALEDPLGITANPHLLALKKAVYQQRSGIGQDDGSIKAYIDLITRVSTKVYATPEILDKFAFSVEDRKTSLDQYNLGPMSQEDRILYYWANPWLYAIDVIGYEALKRTAPAGGDVREIIPKQKLYLRQFCDPRFHGLILVTCRGGSKTWLNALGLTILESFVPRLRITINSGSKTQSQYLYSYFLEFIQDNDLSRLIVGEPLQSHTTFVHGGWVKALTASEKSSRGPRPDVLLYDETCQAEDRFVKAAIGGTWTSKSLKIVFSSTPNKMNHLFYEAWIRYNEWGWTRNHWDCYDVPWISDEAITQAERMYDRNTFNIEMLGLFGSATGSIFNHEDLTASKWDGPILERDLIVESSLGVDWGYAHLTVTTVAAIDRDGMLWVLHTVGKAGVSEKDWCEDIIPGLAHRYDVFGVMADSAGAFQNRALGDALDGDIGVTRVSFKKNKMQMIGELKRRFEKGLIRIPVDVADNDKLLEQLFAYEYEADAGGKPTDKPIKVNDDYVDSLLLAVWGVSG